MIRVFFALLLSLGYAAGFAQGSKTLFAQLNEENGLAQNFVYGILKDSRGFVWISTGDGLTRYDAKSTKNYTTADGLASNFITSSFKMQNGRILFGHFQGSITSYNGVFFESIVSDTLNSEIVSIVETRDHTILCATRSNGLVLWSEDSRLPEFLFPAELQGKIINQIEIVGDHLLAATSEGLYTFQMNGRNLVFNDAPTSLMYEEITSIGPLKSDSLRCWIGTNGKGLLIIKPGTFTRVEQKIEHDNFSNTAISTIVNDTESSLWVGTHQKGLLHFEIENDSTINPVARFDETNGYPIFSINCLFVEPNNVVWAGTLSNGMVKLHDPFFRFYDASQKGIEQVNAIVEGGKGYYVATNEGLFTFHPEAENRSDQYQRVAILKKKPILSLKFIDGKLWIGTKDNGILIYNEQENTVSNITITDNDLTPVKVRLFEPDHAGKIWISAIGEGVMHIDKNGNVLKHFATNTGFIHNDIFAICVDSKNKVWFGSLGAGLAMLDTVGNMHHLSREDRFPSHDINDIIEDNGVIWVATDGKGYFKQDSTGFIRVGPAQESESNFVKSLQPDNDDRLWIATRRSIGYLDVQSGKSRYYDKSDGLLEKEDYASPIYLSSSGNLLLANDRGVTIFDTKAVGQQVILDTHLAEVSISFKAYKPPAPTILEMSKGTYPTIMLDHDQNHVTFDFRAIDTNFTGRVYYRYYLDELEKDWSPPSLSHSITYTSLEPGAYTLHAQATNDLRAWTDLPLNYPFTIDQPYWDTWWFYLLQMLGIIALFGITYLLIRSPIAKRSLGRIMVFMCIFIVFDYLQNWLDPVTPEFIGSVPLYKTLLNLCLALILFPVERWIKTFFKKRERLKNDIRSDLN